MSHIEYIKKQFNKEITIFPGVYTRYVPINKQVEYITNLKNKMHFDETKGFRFKHSGEIGCYLSHYYVIETIMNNNKETSMFDYSVIFEDDVTSDFNNLHDKIENIIKKINNQGIDFDIIFLGTRNGNKGQHIVDDIFYLDKNAECWGTHALLINNKNAEKIFNLGCSITGQIDIHYTNLAVNGKLTCLVISPIICDQSELPSNIQPTTIKFHEANNLNSTIVPLSAPKKLSKKPHFLGRFVFY
jgi:GR25 family glycosyltransferase involved in LPS biosynthesis